MGNRVRRRKIASLLKELKSPIKLYRGPKLAAYALLNQHANNLIKRLEAAKAKALVQDCDAFNHYVKEALVEQRGIMEWAPVSSGNWENRHRSDKGFVAYSEQFLFEDGKLSCCCSAHVQPPAARDKIEEYLLAYYTRPAAQDGRWPLSEREKHMKAILEQGGHIAAEDGTEIPPVGEEHVSD